MDTKSDLYAFVPEHLRHHFHVDAVFGGDAHERHEIRCARRTRSAHLVASALAPASLEPPPPPIESTTKPTASKPVRTRVPVKAATNHGKAAKAAAHAAAAVVRPPSPTVSTLYSPSIEYAITARMTFDLTLARLETYFQEQSDKLVRLEEHVTQHSTVGPAYLYDASTRLPTLLQVQRHIVQAIESCVSDADIYLAMLEQLPSPPAVSPTPLLRFAVASSKSSMQHRVLVCPTPEAPPGQAHALKLPQSNQMDHDQQSSSQPNECISFAVLASQREIVIDDIADFHARERVQCFTADTVTGPFACFPLLSDEVGSEGTSASNRAAIGVLSLDSCRKAQRLRPESMTPVELSEFLTRKHLRDAAMELRRHKLTGAQFLALTDRDVHHAPLFSALKVATRKRLLELRAALQRGAMLHLVRPARYFVDDPDAMQFVHDVAQSAGAFLDTYRGVHWHQALANATRDAMCTVYDVLDVLLRGIARSIDHVARIVVWRIIMTSPAKQQHQPLEIDVLASTDVPDDRLLPFLQWSERLCKRVVLYKESAALDSAAPRLVQGTITRIVLSNQESTTSSASTTKAPAATAPSNLVCESAQYYVTWSDKSVDRYSWRELRQLLPIRAMNTKHFQLTHLIERLEQASLVTSPAPSLIPANSKLVRLDNPHGIALVLQTIRGGQYVLEVDFTSPDASQDNNNNNFGTADTSSIDIPSDRALALLRRTAGVATTSLVCVRGRDARRMRREQSATRVVDTFRSMGLTPSPDALRALRDVVTCVVNELTTNLPGVEVQVAELQPDGAQLQYTFAANGSTLLDKVLDRGQGVSFRCVDTRESQIVQRGSDAASRLRRLGRLPHVSDHNNNAVADEFPFVFVPLVHEDCVVGVLSLNRFVDVPKGRADELQPEAGVLTYLERVAKPLAAAIYLKRRSHALYTLLSFSRKSLQSPHLLIYHACRAIKDVLIGAWKVRVVEVDCARGKTSTVYELSEAERTLATTQDVAIVAPLRLRRSELLDDTIAHHFALSPAQVAVVHARIDAMDVADDADARQLEQLAVEETSKHTGGSKRSLVAVTESERRRLESKRVASKYFTLQLSSSSAKTSSSKSAATTHDTHDRLSNNKYVTNAVRVYLGASATTSFTSDVAAFAQHDARVVLTVSSLPQCHAACERHYVARVSETLSKLLDDLHQRVTRSRERVAALGSFQRLCTQETIALEQRLAADASDDRSTRTSKGATGSNAARPVLTPADELAIENVTVLQQRTIALLERVLAQPNVYIGLLEPAARRIQYTSASTGSCMRGKHLSAGHGVGFDVLATQVSCVITEHDAHTTSRGDASDTSETTSSQLQRLRFFTSEPATQKWPFIAVPIGSLGILSLDNLERYARLASAPQPELGVVDFLRRVGSALHAVIEAARHTSRVARETLRAQALVRIMKVCDDIKTCSALYVQMVVVREVEAALNGVDAYVGIVQPLCESIRFVSASTRSNMADQRVNTVHSASFRVFATQRPLVVPQLRSYLREQNAATIAANGKLKALGNSLASTHEPTGPFVCVPIPFVGVLSVDTFPGAAGGIYSPQQPEAGVVEFLSRAANLVGENLRTRNALAATQRTPTLFEGNKSTFAVVCRELLALLASSMVAVEELHVLRFSRSASVGGDDRMRQELAPLAALKRQGCDFHGNGGAEWSALKQSILQQVRALEAAASTVDGATTDTDSTNTQCVALTDAPEVLLAVLTPTRDVALDNDDERTSATTVLVLRRVRGAVWLYDLELLRSLVPRINAVIDQVNVRVAGIAARRQALCAIDTISRNLESLPARDAVHALRDAVRDALEHVATGLSQSPTRCDVYMGERQVGGDTLAFTIATQESRIENTVINLLDAANASLVCVQCLAHQQPSVIHLFDARNNKMLRSLSDKKVARVYIVVPVGDNRILCADSLGMDAFVPTTRRLEADVLQFFHTSATKLRDLVLSTHYRRSYNDLVRLKAPTARHANFRAFFATLLQIIRRDLVVVHSQQILTLASDFTGRYHTEAWYAAPTQRPLAPHSRAATATSPAATATAMPLHMCYLNHCEVHLIPLRIHYESRMQLPMTNLPRTLDVSRATLEPAVGIEKRGVFACTCLATMLDAHVVAAPARVALCIYTHDAQDRGGSRSHVSKPTVFTSHQRQFFFALAAVAADVFPHVYRSVALFSIANELLFSLRELLGAKDGLVVHVQSIASTMTASSNSNEANADDRTRCVVLCSSQDAKFPRQSELSDPLATKVLQFAHATTTNVAIFARKLADAAPLAAAASAATVQSDILTTQHASDASSSSSSKQQTKTTLSHSFFPRPGNLFRSRKPKDTALPSSQATPQTHEHDDAVARAVSNSVDDLLLRQPRYKFHVLVRSVTVFEQPLLLSLNVERRGLDSAKALEQLANQWRERTRDIVDTFQTRPVRGDDVMLCDVLGAEARCDAYHVDAGGGYYLLTYLQQARERFQHESLGLTTDIRGFLTGVQATARDAMVSSRVAPPPGGLDHARTIAPPLEPVPSVFAADEQSTTTLAAAALVLLEASMVLVGYTKDALAKLNERALLTEFLRANVVQKLVDANPRDRKHWSRMLRAKALLTQAQNKLTVIQMTTSTPALVPALPHTSAAARPISMTITHARRTLDANTARAAVDPPRSALTALQAMYVLHAALIAIVRFEKQLDVDAASERQRIDCSATVLQCFARKVRARAALQQRRAAFVAARTIQCAFRQHLARRHVLFLKWTRAAIKIQRAYRRKLLRRKGSRPKKLSDELLAISKQFGGLAAETDATTDTNDSDSAWRTEMDAFASFSQYITSRAGKEQLQREVSVMTKRRQALVKERDKLAPADRVVEDVKDLFELAAVGSSDSGGELSRDAMREMIARLHIPLAADEVADVIDMMDNDRSGTISLAEFMRWFTHEFAVLKKRSRDCGTVSRKEWQWGIERAARAALRKRYRALRIGRQASVGQRERDAEDGDAGTIDSNGNE